MNKTQIQIINYGLLPLSLLAIVNPVKADSVPSFLPENPPLNIVQNNNLEKIIDVVFETTENGLQITIVTESGKTLIPLIMNDENELTIELLDTTIDRQFIELNPTEDINQITVTQVNDTVVNIVIRGENDRIPRAEIISNGGNLVLSITEATDFDVVDYSGRINITITGTRTPRLLLDSASSITIIDSQQIEQQVVRDIQDLVRYEPGVSVGRNASRFGNQDFNIRGIDGNRVLLQVDGIRVPDNYVGRGRDYFNIETIKRVEIIKGPASALYGSDAIGGVVSFITKDPQDYLDVFGKSFYNSGQITYDSSDESISLTGVMALEDKEGKLQFSTVATYTGADELKTASGVQVNPQDIKDYSLTSKLVYNINENNSLKLTGEFLYGTTDTDILNEVGVTPFNVRPPNIVLFD